jgi:hypothetical protein
VSGTRLRSWCLRGGAQVTRVFAITAIVTRQSMALPSRNALTIVHTMRRFVRDRTLSVSGFAFVRTDLGC